MGEVIFKDFERVDAVHVGRQPHNTNPELEKARAMISELDSMHARRAELSSKLAGIVPRMS
jgi:hypothetical protein